MTHRPSTSCLNQWCLHQPVFPDDCEEKYGWNQKRYLSVLKERALSEGKTIKHFWLLGGELLTEEQELERLKRIGLVEQNIESLSDAKKTLREEIIRLYEL